MEKSETVILATDLGKNYEIGDTRIEVLNSVNLEAKNGDFVVVSGASGSGKTTLLNIIGNIDKPTSGKIVVFGNDLCSKDEDFLSDFRCRNVGFVFQAYNLVSTLTVAENTAFPMEWLHKPADHVEKRVADLLDVVGLQNRADHFPSQLSGGEQQRVAFARALANDPPLLLIDEPTGNLDAQTSLRIVQLLQKLKEDGKTVVLTTHDERMFPLADQRLNLEDGKLVAMDE